VFLNRDGAFLLVVDGGPLQAGNDGRGQPIHINREVVDLPQKRIRRNRAGAQHGKQMFTLRFNQDAIADLRATSR